MMQAMQQASGGENSLILINPLYLSNEQEHLRRLVRVFMRVEDLGFVLFWCKAQTSHIAFIELPRLKLRFQSVRTRSGKMRLACVQHEGFYLHEHEIDAPKSAEAFSSVDYRTHSLLQLLDGIPQYLLLENENNELKVLTPSHPPTRPRIADAPFATILTFSRGDPGWADTMKDARVFQLDV